MHTILSTILGVSLLLPSLASAATLTVTVGDDSGTGSLREALANAVDGDEIVFQGVSVVTLSSGLTVEADVQIEGGAGVSIESDGGSFSILTVPADTTLTLQDITLAHGVASSVGRGAGLSNDGTVTMRRSVIRDCAAFNAGGFDNRGLLVVEASAILDNQTTGNSGAGGINSGTLVVRNTTFAGNDATGSDRVGGALGQFGEDAEAIVTHSTFVDNTATGQGGAIYVSEGTLSMRNTLVADNDAPGGPDVWGTVRSHGYNLIEQSGGLTLLDAADTDLLDVDPLVQPLDGTGLFVVPIGNDSPAFEAGTCTESEGGGVAADARGTARPQGFACDIGAFEVTVAARTTVTPEPAGDTCPDGGDLVEYGLDLNGDGMLDGDEVVSATYICSQGNRVTLVTVTEQPPGDACEAGGQRIDVGPDDDGDEVLSDGEIDETSYVCTEVETTEVVTEVPSGGCATVPASVAVGLGLFPVAFLRRRRLSE